MKQEIWQKIIEDKTLVHFVEQNGLCRPVLKNPTEITDANVGELIICLYEPTEEFTIVKLKDGIIEARSDDNYASIRIFHPDSCLTKKKALELFKGLKKEQYETVIKPKAEKTMAENGKSAFGRKKE